MDSTELSSPQTQNTVLVVDDNEDNLPLLKAILESAKFTVYTASSVQNAREILTEPGRSIDLVLSDISMPVETGFDLLSWMRNPANQLSHTPVLLITAALPEEENRVKGLSMGAVDYIVRPINNQELTLRVKNALEHYKQFRSLRSTLESSEDMAMTGRILAAANHEIRNLVGLINITSEQALTAAERGLDMKPGSAGFQSLSALSQMTKLLTQISRDLNTHIHAEKISTRVCSARDILDEVFNIARQKISAISVERPKANDQLYVYADATRAKQIILNFILNALDAITEKGPESSGRISVLVTENGPEKLQIRITDNGIGLHQAETRTAFEPFQTTKAVRGGKGLGLWLCSRLAQAMGGRIALESNGPATGATALLELRRGEAPRQHDFNINDYLMD